MKEVEKVHATAYHRNGVCGAPFGLVLFQPNSEYGQDRQFLGVVFDDHHTAVLDVGLLAEGVIEFGENSWRGDHFEPELIEVLEAAEHSPYPDPEPEERDYEVTVEFVRPPDEFVRLVKATSQEEAEEKALEALYESLTVDGTTEDVEVTDIDVEELV